MHAIEGDQIKLINVSIYCLPVRGMCEVDEQEGGRGAASTASLPHCCNCKYKLKKT
jgi:hypothetical protein